MWHWRKYLNWKKIHITIKKRKKFNEVAALWLQFLHMVTGMLVFQTFLLRSDLLKLVSRCWHQSKFSPLASSWNIHHHLKRWPSHLHNEAQKEKGRGCVSRDGVKVLSPPFRHFLLSFETFSILSGECPWPPGHCVLVNSRPFFSPVYTFIKMELSYWVVLLGTALFIAM